MPVEIHGKQYITVAERLNLLVADTDGIYDLDSNIVQISDDAVVIKATITIPEKGTWTGHAHEIKSSSFINKTSYIENCETSAIGRALASAGYGGTEFCSADELANALKNQDNSVVNAYKKDKASKNSEKKATKEDWDV